MSKGAHIRLSLALTEFLEEYKQPDESMSKALDRFIKQILADCE